MVRRKNCGLGGQVTVKSGTLRSRGQVTVESSTLRSRGQVTVKSGTLRSRGAAAIYGQTDKLRSRGGDGQFFMRVRGIFVFLYSASRFFWAFKRL